MFLPKKPTVLNLGKPENEKNLNSEACQKNWVNHQFGLSSITLSCLISKLYDNNK